MKMKLGGIIVTGGLIILAFRYCPIPWSAAFLFIAILLAIFACQAKRAGVAVLMANLVAVFLALVIFEAYIGFGGLQGDGTRMAGTIVDGFTRPDDRLGYTPNENASVTAKKYFGDMLLYDVVYSIDGQGLRISPPSGKSVPDGCVVFFGDSVTFGEGVNDVEAFPYRVGGMTKGRYTVYNFAFSGYGPHQMLANLQSGLVEQRIDCNPTHFFFLTFPQHIARVAGLTSWDHHGPRFALTKDREAVRAGNFDDPKHIIGQLRVPRWAEQAINKSFIWQRFFGSARDVTPADLGLLTAVVRESARLAKQRYPDSTFQVLLWDGRADERVTAMEKELRSADIPVHLITDAIPDIRANWTKYILSIHDPHPNPLQHERIADYVVHKILAVD